MKKRIVSILLLLAILTSLLACQSGDGTETESGSESEGSGSGGTETDGVGEGGNNENGDGQNNGNDDGKVNAKPGNKVGNLAHAMDLDLIGYFGTVNIEDYRGKIVVVNFWGTWCPPCKKELPHFNEIANDYSDDVVVITVHSTANLAFAPEYIDTNYPNSKMIFAYDKLIDEDVPELGDLYFMMLGGSIYYPRTVVLDSDGVITFAQDGMLSYDALETEILKAKK